MFLIQSILMDGSFRGSIRFRKHFNKDVSE